MAAGGGPALAAAFVVRLLDLRSLVRAGFTLQDVRFGAMAYALQRSEELADQRQRSTPLGRFLRAVAIGSASLVGVGFLFALSSAAVSSVLEVLGGLLTAMLVLTYVAVASGWWNRLRRRRAAMWSGPVGEYLFGLASRTVKHNAR